jgi:glycosyltransferase involved in cell wall biosynthesis
VGRLSDEKGLDVLIDAWSRLPGRLPLKIIGDGPWAARVRDAESRDPRVAWLGRVSIQTVYELIGGATCLILPSRCYENCPKTILEAYSKGTPVVASRLGAMREYVADGETGLLFQPGDAADLACKIRSLFSASERQPWMRFAARQTYETRYTADVNFEMLMRIYARAAGRLAEERLPSPLVTRPPVPVVPLLRSEDIGYSGPMGSAGESSLV